MHKDIKLLVVTNLIDRPEKALFTGLRRRGVDLDIICMPQARWQREMMELGIEVMPLTIHHRMDLRAAGMIRRRLAYKNYDAIYAPRNNCLAAALLAARKRKIRIIGYRGTSGHLSRLNPADWLTYFNPRVDRICCVSDAVRRYLLGKNIAAFRLKTIYKGHELAWYDEIEAKPLETFGITQDVFVAGFVGNIRPVKGVKSIIRSADHLVPGRDIHFCLIGEIRDRSVARIAGSKHCPANLHFTGFQDEGAAFMKSFSVFLMPSVKREGFPKALIEAMAQEIVPVVTNIGGMPEIVRHLENGLIVPPKDPKAIAEAIQYLAANPQQRRQLGKNARDTIKTKFGTGQMVEQMLQLLAEVLKNN